MLNCKPLKVAAEGNSASETTWGTIDVQAGALKQTHSNEKHAAQDEAGIEQMQPTKHR